MLGEHVAQPLAVDFSMQIYEEIQNAGEFFTHKWTKGAERVWEEECITRLTKVSVAEIDDNQVIVARNHSSEGNYF